MLPLCVSRIQLSSANWRAEGKYTSLSFHRFKPGGDIWHNRDRQEGIDGSGMVSGPSWLQQVCSLYSRHPDFTLYGCELWPSRVYFSTLEVRIQSCLFGGRSLFSTDFIPTDPCESRLRLFQVPPYVASRKSRE